MECESKKHSALPLIIIIAILLFVLDKCLHRSIEIDGRRRKVPRNLKYKETVYNVNYFPDGEIASKWPVDSDTQQKIDEALFHTTLSSY